MAKGFRTRQRSPVRFSIAAAWHRAQMDRVSRLRHPFLYDRDIFVAVACLAVILAMPQAGSHDERFSRRGLFHFPP